jgi:pimeloyl-ACP methyl ester carboxylesterase
VRKAHWYGGGAMPGRPLPVLVAGGLLVAVASCTLRNPTATKSEPTDLGDELDWGTCEEGVESDFECATLVVPLDYDERGGETIPIALIRYPATGDREGAVLVNPGGPGGSGYDIVANAGPVISEQMGLGAFDIVGFDPRGVDRSNGIRCLDDAAMDATMYLDDTPDSPAEQQAVDDAEQQLYDACRATYGDTLVEYSTDNVARDMDGIRVGLGDEQISYIGISYGTYLGAVYATLFPERVRAMVLDSAYEPTGDTPTQQHVTQLAGFEGAFDNWAAWCESNDACAFRATDVAARWDMLRDELDSDPVRGDDGREANRVVMEIATISSLYSDAAWPLLGAALADVESGDPKQLFLLADEYTGRQPDGTWLTITQSNRVIDCASGINAKTPPDPQAILDEMKQAAPRFAKYLSLDDVESTCAQLIGTEVDPPPIGYDGNAPILVVGGTNDPATPYRWAEELTAVMGSNARLLTFTGEGHGQLLSSSCVTEAEATAITDLALPEPGTTCDRDPPVERPEWWDDIPVPDGVSDPVDEPAITNLLGATETFGYVELRFSALDANETLDGYDNTLDAAGFDTLGRDEPFAGAPRGVYSAPNGDFFIVLVFGEQAYEDDDLAALAEFVPEGEHLVLQAYVPQ